MQTHHTVADKYYLPHPYIISKAVICTRLRIPLDIIRINIPNQPQKGKKRQRKSGGGAVPTILRMHEDRLFFILVYIKLNPLQSVLGFLFGMSQDRANEWIERLSIVLKKALGLAGDLPARDAESAQSTLEASVVQEFIIDGMERRIQRPSEQAKQKEHYSGKKKTHTVKDVFRNTREGYDDLAIEIACALHNNRTRYRNA